VNVIILGQTPITGREARLAFVPDGVVVRLAAQYFRELADDINVPPPKDRPYPLGQTGLLNTVLTRLSAVRVHANNGWKRVTDAPFTLA
jgi:uracil DNA glycosylase